MKTLGIYSLSALFILLTLFSCQPQKSDDNTVTAQKIVPGSDTGGNAISTDKTLDTRAESILDSAQIVIDRDYTVYDIKNVNLDEDDSEEQVILACPLNEDKDVFRVYIADYDSGSDEYKEIYSSEIGQYNLNVASIQTEDITGDHHLEILISGVDTKDQQVFVALKLIPGKNGAPFTVKKIFDKAVDGDVDVINSDRGNDYKIEQLNGESYPIEVQRKNPENEKTLIVEKYKWNEKSTVYELSSSEKVKISTLSNENLLNFYRGTSVDYLNFLKGPWYRTKDLDGNPTHNMNEIFEVLPEDRTLTFYSGDIQESFTWTKNSEPVKYRHVLSFWDVRNNFLKSMYFSISIYIDSFDSIQVKIRGNQRWGGTYTQLTDNLQKALTDTSRENLLLSDVKINGLYKTNLNTEIVFDSPEYVMREDGKETKGIYTIFELNGNLIMEMKELSENGLTRKVRTYGMKYSETTEDLRIIRTITLQKGELEAQGIVPESNSELHFEQIEKVNQDQPENQQ